MRIRYDSETDTLTIKLKEDPVFDSEYIEGKGIVVDYNKNNEIVGYEIHGWSRFQKTGEDLLLKESSDKVSNL